MKRSHESRRPRIASLVLVLVLALWLGAPVQAGPESCAEVDLTTTPTRTREDFFRKAAALPLGLEPTDSAKDAVRKIGAFLDTCQPRPGYPDDVYALATLQETVRAGLMDEYCIGAILVDEKGQILLRAHNTQFSTKRSDLHGEMTLLTLFETDPKFSEYRKGVVMRPGMRVYSSAEPCPMCLIRLATVAVDTRYVAGSVEDGMASRIQYLPGAWRTLCEAHPATQARCSPVLRSLGHLLFYTFLLRDDSLYDYGK